MFIPNVLSRDRLRSLRKPVLNSTKNSPESGRRGRSAWSAGSMFAAAFIGSASLFSGTVGANAQTVEPLKAGEAYATRFSGTVTEGDVTTLNLDGTVGSILDLRSPNTKPVGQHWQDEPQRAFLKAREAGQVFGVAFDDASPANIYVTATSKFGLHWSKDAWMAGQWGAEGGPGTVYRLSADNGYQPEVFATVTLDGRENTGAALGNIAFDKQSKQLFVSDMETGMIHRIDATSGTINGQFDHGIDGRSVFFDAAIDADASLPIIEFNPDTAAKTKECESEFSKTPSCWNFADFQRRVWGLGVRTDAESKTSRLYYSVWSSAALGSEGWDEAEDKQNSVWSIALKEDGSFDLTSVRREFDLPVSNDGSVPEAGVSDIAFSSDGEMLVAETGVIRNLGLETDDAFAKPNNARVLKYKLVESGVWQNNTRYDVGGVGEKDKNNAAGGVDFGYGYTSEGKIDPKKPDQFVWKSGDDLCTIDAPCNSANDRTVGDDDEVHGYQGTARSDGQEIETGDDGEIVLASDEPSAGINKSYLIDADVNVDADGAVDIDAATRNDGTRVGDIEVFDAGEVTPVAPIITPIDTHAKQMSAFHRKYQSGVHDRRVSTPVHRRTRSHNREGSHSRTRSHNRKGSHSRTRSHNRTGSHSRRRSHARDGSHDRRRSHVRTGSHSKKASHTRIRSHSRRRSHARDGSHDRRRSHVRTGSHSKARSHTRIRSHSRKRSHARTGSHDRRRSHLRKGSHSKKASHTRIRSHSRKRSHARTGSHDRRRSHLRKGSHSKKASHTRIRSHSRKRSHARTGSHDRRRSHARKGSHNKARSHARKGSHNKARSHHRTRSHNKARSHNRKGSHNKRRSHARTGSHNKVRSHARTRSHNKRRSHARTRSHNKARSHARTRSHNRRISQLRNQ